MRILVTILLATAMSHADTDAQTKETSGKQRVNLFGTIDYKACEANPRWLLVTVVEREVQVQDDEGVYKRFDEVSHSREETKLVDRCEISLISEWTRASGKGNTEIVQGRPGSFTVLRIKESLQDICSVLPDCADATSLEGKL